MVLGECLKRTTRTLHPGSSTVFMPVAPADFLKWKTQDLRLLELGNLEKLPIRIHFQVELKGTDHCNSSQATMDLCISAFICPKAGCDEDLKSYVCL